MIIDGHGHACGEYLTTNDILNKLNKNNVDMVVLVPGELNSKKTYNLKDYTKADKNFDVVLKSNKLTRKIMTLTNMKRIIKRGNDFVYKLKNEAPDRIKQFYWITKKQWCHIDEDYNRMNFDGIKLHQCWESFDVESCWFESVVEWSIRKNLPMFLHLYSHDEIHHLIQIIKKYPDAKIIVAHCFGLEILIKEDINDLKNVYIDISNCYFVSEIRILKAIKHFGSERVIMGSDTPYGRDALEKTIVLIHKLPITSEEKNNILGENLRSLLHIT